MNTVLWRAWELLGGLATPKFVTRETAVLLILAASLLVFRTLRERCLMVWIVGLLAYLGSHHALVSASGQANPYATPVGHAEFILAVALFAAGACVPDLDSAILRAGNHPFAFAVEADTSDVALVTLEGKHRVWVG